MVGDLPAEVQIDGGVPARQRRLVRRQEQRAAQEDPHPSPQRRLQSTAATGGPGCRDGPDGVDQQAEPEGPGYKDQPQQVQPEPADLGEQQ